MISAAEEIGEDGMVLLEQIWAEDAPLYLRSVRRCVNVGFLNFGLAVSKRARATLDRSPFMCNHLLTGLRLHPATPGVEQLNSPYKKSGNRSRI
jgi:hypothetical protein